MMADDEPDTPAEAPGDEQPVTPAETPEGPVASEEGGDPAAAQDPSPQELEEAAEEIVEEVVEEIVAEEIVAEEIAEEAAEETVAEEIAEEIVAEEEASAAAAAAAAAEDAEDGEEPAVRVKPAVPGAHLEVDIVPEGVDPLGRSEEYVDPYAIEDDEVAGDGEGDEEEREEALTEPIATAAIDLAAGARYRATGKRKTAIARVTLRPGSGTYLVNGRTLEEHFPRGTLQRNIRQPLETVGYQERMDVVARLHGGGISAQAGALRHGVSRALLEADPNLRGELKRRGFLTRDSRAKERKKAGLKKARKRPQFSKR
jgi:small subunit ribosomal protein S9